MEPIRKIDQTPPTNDGGKIVPFWPNQGETKLRVGMRLIVPVRSFRLFGLTLRKAYDREMVVTDVVYSDGRLISWEGLDICDI